MLSLLVKFDTGVFQNVFHYISLAALSLGPLYCKRGHQKVLLKMTIMEQDSPVPFKIAQSVLAPFVRLYAARPIPILITEIALYEYRHFKGPILYCIVVRTYYN